MQSYPLVSPDDKTEIPACSQYYEVDMQKITKDGYCLLYNVDGTLPNPFVAKNVVKPVTNEEGTHYYCPVSYSDSTGDYSIIPLNVDEISGSGLSPVQLVPGYAGYGDGGDADKDGAYITESSTDSQVIYRRAGTSTPVFTFGPIEHGVKTGGDINIPVLMSRKKVTYDAKDAKPRLVDCLTLFNEPGLNNVELDFSDTAAPTCTAHFNCAKYLDEKSVASKNISGYSNNKIMDTNNNWTGGFCPGGGRQSTGVIETSDGKEILSDFTRCHIYE